MAPGGDSGRPRQRSLSPRVVLLYLARGVGTLL